MTDLEVVDNLDSSIDLEVDNLGVNTDTEVDPGVHIEVGVDLEACIVP